MISWQETPLKFRDFNFFIVGYFVSVVGTWLHNTAQVWLVYKLTYSSFYLGLFSFLTSFPGFLLVLFGGFLIDFFDRKFLLVFTTFLSIFPPLILGILTEFNLLNYWSFTLLAFLLGILNTFEVPLRQVFISELVPFSLITKSVSFLSLSLNTARMVGPFLAGLIFSSIGFAYCFYLNSLTFLFFLFMLTQIKILPKVKKEKKDLKTLYKEPIIFLKKEKNILALLLSVGVFTFFGSSIVILLPLIIHTFFQKGSKEFAFLSSFIGLGAISGALFVIFKKNLKNEIKHLLKATFLLAIGITGLNFIKNWHLTKIFCVLIGFSFTNFFPVANSFIQKNTPLYIRGRIISLFILAYLGIYPLGDLFIGFLAEYINLHIVLVINVLFLITLNFILLKSTIKSKNVTFCS
ncbi:MAG: putative arabinose efflux permease AraJ [Thermodesulfobacterium sp.]|uniref:Arabinose efflux permease AraJ n=1 Tax=Candidatus Thermodesulfobacterium syntrophicum TaxID=3060442 RepID=A0AAE3TEE7_9BACT|nr:putative arabinose efflux permease AraJ [Candidatus Thermodesulfobacterium syntrophicum]